MKPLLNTQSIKPAVPVVLFAFNRKKQLEQVLAQLKRNQIAELIVYLDGPRDPDDNKKVDVVHQLLKKVNWTKIKIIRRKKNLGLSESIQAGLNEVFMSHERAIVIEDDIVVADGFYDYMCRALEVYADRTDIAGITGLRYPFKSRALKGGVADVFLAPRFSSWGWGTWRRVWREVDFHKGSLQDKVAKHKPDLTRGGGDVAYAYREYAADRLKGCWDVVFATNMALNDQYFVCPKYNLVQNAGLTEGSHSTGATDWSLTWERTSGDLKNLPSDLSINDKIIQKFKGYIKSNVKVPMLPRVKYHLRQTIKGVLAKAPKPKSFNPKDYTTTDGPQEVLSQKECYYFALNNYVKDSDRVLDVGMGIGYGMGVLSIKAKEVYAVDVDKKAVQYNRQRLIGKNPRVKELILYDGITLPFKDNFFDVVTCVDVIEHVQDYDHFLKELIRVSKQTVVIATPNRRPEYTNPDGTPKNHWHLREWSYEEFDIIAHKQTLAAVNWHFLNGSWEGPHTISTSEKPDTLALLPVFHKKIRKK